MDSKKKYIISSITVLAASAVIIGWIIKDQKDMAKTERDAKKEAAADIGDSDDENITISSKRDVEKILDDTDLMVNSSESEMKSEDE